MEIKGSLHHSWAPNHCGQSNIYMHPYRCKVSGAGTRQLAPAKAPVWCEDDATKCLKGAKQMIAWAQLDGNNVFVSGTQKDGGWKSPAYNMKMGFYNGEA